MAEKASSWPPIKMTTVLPVLALNKDGAYGTGSLTVWIPVAVFFFFSLKIRVCRLK